MDKVNVLLIDFQGRLFSNLQDLSNNQIVLPIGLMYLSSCLKSSMDNVDVKLAKSFIDFKNMDELLSIINEFKPGVIGIRCLSLDIESLFECARYIRENYHAQRYIITVGGPVTNSDTREVYLSKLFDYVAIGEGERTFVEIVKAFSQGEEVKNAIKGIVYSEKDYVKDYIENLDEIPFPDYDLIYFDKYDKCINYGYNRHRQGVILTSRGCPYKCIYCHNIFGNKARLRSPENVFKEMEFLYKEHNIKDIFIVDDIFNIDYKRAMHIFDLIIESKLPLKLYFPNGIRGDIIDRDYIDRMIEAGTIYITFAVETASERLQKVIKKNINLKKLKENIEYTCEKGILVNAFFLFGLPTETEEEAMLTLKYAEELNKLNFPFVFFARYYPGTEMYDLAVQSGFSEDMLNNSTSYLYHEITDYSTPTLNMDFVNYIKNYFLYKILLNEERVNNMLKIQRKIYEEGDIINFINSMYNLRIKSSGEFEAYVNGVTKSSYVRKLLEYPKI